MRKLNPDRDGNKARDAFKIQEAGYIYYTSNLKSKTGMQGKMVEKVLSGSEPHGVTLASAPGMELGQVTKIIAMPATSNKMRDVSLRDLARLRLTKRVNPNYNSFEEFSKIRSACHLIEVANGDCYCDCHEGIKGRICISLCQKLQSTSDDLPLLA